MPFDFQHYYGTFFIGLLNAFRDETFCFKEFETKSRSSYIVSLQDKSVGVYIKYTKKRTTPWQFTFSKEHQDEIVEMNDKLGEVFLILVCGEDGIVLLTFAEFRSALDEMHEAFENITVNRPKRGRYGVSGHNGKLKHKIQNNDFKKVMNYLKKSHT